jgi:hypothetical protein
MVLFFASVATHVVLHRVSIRTYVSRLDSVPVEVSSHKDFQLEFRHCARTSRFENGSGYPRHRF